MKELTQVVVTLVGTQCDIPAYLFVCLLFGVAVSVPGEGSCCFVQWQVEMK